MLYRPCPDIAAPDEADLDDPAMALAADALERGEQDLLMLSRLAEIAMELAEALGAHAKARLAAATGEGAALGAGEDPTGPFNRIAQTVRRTLALRAKVAEEVKTGRGRLAGERAARRAKRQADHRKDKHAAIERGFFDAVAEDRPDLEGEAAERLTDEMDELLYDCDEFRDFLDRPVGETIARLCKTLGLDPALCVRDGDGWKVRREPFPFERHPPPSPSWGGTDGEAVRVGKSEASTGPAGFS
jgi:hypothetical protein